MLLTVYPLQAQSTDTELEYDNYILVTVSPDGGITVAIEGIHSESYSPMDLHSEIKDFDMSIDVMVEDEDTSIIDSEIIVQLDPSYYSDLANLDLDIEAHSDDTVTNITAYVDYPGYLGVNGSLGLVIVEPPYGFVLDLMLEVKLYYTIYPREELEMLTAMLPLLETQLSSMIMEASDGNVIMENFELLDYEEGEEYATLTVSMRLSGDLQEGIMSAIEEYGAEITPPEVTEELPALTMESVDYQFSFSGETLTLEANVGGTITGDLSAELNKLKDASLEELLESGELDADDRTLVSSALPIDIHLGHLLIETSYTFGDESSELSFSVVGLGLEPPSFETLMIFLEKLSDRGLEDIMLVLEGESIGNQYVLFTVPDETKEPILLEEQMVVWEMDNIENLRDVTYEVKTEQIQTTTLIIGSVMGLAVVGAAVYVLRTRI